MKIKWIKLLFCFVAFITLVICAFIAGASREQSILYKIVDFKSDGNKTFSYCLSESPLILSKNDSVFLFSSPLIKIVEKFSPSKSSITFYSKDNTVTIGSKFGEHSLIKQPYEDPNNSFYFVPELREILTSYKGEDYYVIYGVCLLDNKKYVVIYFPITKSDCQSGVGAAYRLER